MNVRTRQIERAAGTGPAAIVEVAGAVSATDAPAMTAHLEHVERAGLPLVIDLSRATLIDAATVRVLRHAAVVWSQHARGFAVAAPAGQPLRALEVLGVATCLNLHATVAGAVADLDPPCAGAGVPIGVAVHRLLADAQRPGVDPAERRRIEDQAIDIALPLARTLAGRYRRFSGSYDELIQIASVGMIAAVRRYDAHRGSGFVAFAVPTVLGELRRHFRDHTAALRLPRRLHEIRSEAFHLMPVMAQELQRQPTHPELAARIGVPVADLAAAVDSTHQPVSLDASMTDSETTLHTVIGHDDQQFDLTDIRVSLRPLIESLPPTFAKSCGYASPTTSPRDRSPPTSAHRR
jgi:RNA polymerase sigma-B factor